MGIGRWIGGFLGFINGGPLGALAGYAIGWLFDKGAEALATTPTTRSTTARTETATHTAAIQPSSSMRDSATRSSSRCSCSPRTS